MARQDNLAYDLRNFEPSVSPKQQPQPSIKKVPRKKPADYVRPYKAIVLIMLVTFITASMIYSTVQISEISDDINTLNQELQIQQSEAVRLNAELNMAVSMDSVKTYAEDVLGFVQFDPNQVEYVTLSQGNHIELPEEPKPSFFEKIQNIWQNFVEYLLS